jgi:nucleotide-binding universal stress UspA family protein
MSDRDQLSATNLPDLRISRVLCPVDFSHNSNLAVDYALMLGHQFSAPVLILHVAEDPTFAAPGQRPELSTAFTQSQRRDLEQKLEVYGHKRSHGEVTTNTQLLVVTNKTVVQAIVDVADESQASLVVMGTRGYSGLKRLMFGSVTEGVLRHSPVPVLAVPPQEPTPGPHPGP